VQVGRHLPDQPPRTLLLALPSESHLTRRQIIYLPVSPTPAFTSFAVPILNITDSRVTAPWFGANKWEASLTPVPAGGIPSDHAALDLVMEFKEGGAFDFATTFERLRERLRHAVDVAQTESQAQRPSLDTRAGALDGANLAGVHLEDLPAYEDTRYVRVPEAVPTPVGRGSVGTQGTGSSPGRSSPLGSPRGGVFQPQPPLEPPPGYEEVQRGVVAEEVERRMRGSV
jgi:hypothetical protein